MIHFKCVGSYHPHTLHLDVAETRRGDRRTRYLCREDQVANAMGKELTSGTHTSIIGRGKSIKKGYIGPVRWRDSVELLVRSVQNFILFSFFFLARN
jgi:hypothetical protein